MPPALPLVVLAAAMLTLGCAGTPAGDAGDLAPAASEVQTLTFAWPDDLEADVEVRTVRIQDDGRARSERAIDARYRLRSEPRGESLRIVSEGLTLASVDGQPQTQRPADTADDPAGAALLAPTVLVDRDGTLLEVEGIPELRREVAKRIVAKTGPDMADRAEMIAARVVSMEKLSELWNAAVESWIGVEVEPGQSYEMEVEEGGLSRPGSLEVSERIPCASGDGKDGCLRLLLECWLDGEAAGASFVSNLGEVIADLGVAVPANANVRLTEWRDAIELLTEPERLVPHRVRWRRELRFEFDVAGERASLSRIDETEHRYRY